jgi:WD40 repeat protein
VRAVAPLPGGRVVTGGEDRRVLVWDPAAPGAGPAELGRHEKELIAMAVLPGGRVVAGGYDGRVLVWDPAAPGAGPAELGRHDGWVIAVAPLPGGRVVTGGEDRRVLVWDPAKAGAPVLQLSCPLTTLAATPRNPATSDLVIAHQGSGFSLWSVTGATREHARFARYVHRY